ncbi:hypothetical protein [Aequorivita capsosiphonis]|uniref:hypothetical protein n=1 Tax=Aequorivita capsosiphonis TaxID=487317 RepID=UPI0003F6E042|nr:hypothetical protein [Aequorivita capsosiphonis]
MKSLLLSCFVFSLIFISCNKDDNQPEEQQQTESNFYALTIGNSWRYEYFKRIDRTDEFESLNAFDDVAITGTSEINGNTYYTFETTTSGNDNTSILVPENGTVVTNLRDSLGYLINENGVKQFSYSNPDQEYLIRQMTNELNIYGVLTESDSALEVPAGNFECFVNELYVRFSDGNTSPGRDFYFYSERIGKIKSTISWVSDSLHSAEIRLVSYSFPN